VKILITGGAGYIGTVLVDALLARRFSSAIKVVDIGLFPPGMNYLRERATSDPRLQIEVVNVVNPPVGICDGFDVVMHLAGLSNDPMADFRPDLNQLLNVNATEAILRSASHAGVRRFMFASSCSIYGNGGSFGLTEGSPTNPLSGYAQSKLDAEAIVNSFPQLNPVILRQGTVSGPSPRMRWDLIINTMVMHVLRDQSIRVCGIGDAIRPLISVRDLSEAWIRLMNAPSGIYNVATKRGEGCGQYEGYSVASVAALVAEESLHRGYPSSLHFDVNREEKRSYDVSCGKLRHELGWSPGEGVAAIATEIINWHDDGRLPSFDDPRTRNIDWMKAVLEAQAIPLVGA
jgi:nucleoside-diphosphate-sugar epimerase